MTNQSTVLPGFYSLTARTGDQVLGAVTVEHCLTLATLTRGVQVEWVDWPPVPTHLTDEASTRADDTPGDMLDTETDCSGESVDQVTGVKLDHVLDAVGVSLCVEILSRPDCLRQSNLDSLLISFGTS